MKIELYPAGRIKIPDPVLTEDMQRYLIAYLWRNKPEMILDIVCEECPEHIGEAK